MKGFQWRFSRWLTALLIGLLVVLGMLAEHRLRERIQPGPLQVPAAEQGSAGAPAQADGALHEVSQRAWTGFARPRWVF